MTMQKLTCCAFKLTCCAFAAASLAFGAVAAETDHPWQFNETDRAGEYAPAAAVTAAKATDSAWTCPAWIEAFISGVVPFGSLLILR